MEIILLSDKRKRMIMHVYFYSLLKIWATFYWNESVKHYKTLQNYAIKLYIHLFFLWTCLSIRHFFLHGRPLVMCQYVGCFFIRDLNLAKKNLSEGAHDKVGINIMKGTIKWVHNVSDTSWIDKFCIKKRMYSRVILILSK